MSEYIKGTLEDSEVMHNLFRRMCGVRINCKLTIGEMAVMEKYGITRDKNSSMFRIESGLLCDCYRWYGANTHIHRHGRLHPQKINVCDMALKRAERDRNSGYIDRNLDAHTHGFNKLKFYLDDIRENREDILRAKEQYLKQCQRAFDDYESDVRWATESIATAREKINELTGKTRRKLI